jgi:hypothetical protein
VRNDRTVVVGKPSTMSWTGPMAMRVSSVAETIERRLPGRFI